MLPVNYRYKVYVDPKNKQIYCSNGPYLELFQLENGVILFKKIWKIFENGEAITGIIEYSSNDENTHGGHTDCLIINSDKEIVLFNFIKETIISNGHCLDRIISTNVLNTGEILVLVGQKKLLLYKVFDNEIRKESELSLGTKSTIFYGIIIGKTLENLSVYTGNVMGIIEAFEPRILTGNVNARLIIKENNGMIFGIQVLKDKIYSISDDRSLRVFDNNTGQQIDISYGHETRPRSLIVFENKDNEAEIYSGAEIVNKWESKNELKLLDRYEPDIGHIYSLDYVDGMLLMASVNGAFYGLNTMKNQIKKFIISKLDDLIIRSFVKVVDDEYYLIDDKRNLYYLKNDKRTLIMEGNNLKFETLKISKNKELLVATNDKKIFIIDTKTKKFTTILTENVLGGVVFADNDLIAASNTGNAVKLTINNDILYKNEWKLQMRSHISTAIKHNGFYIIGFGLGSIIVCKANDNFEEMFHYKICKKKRGESVTDLSIINDRLYALTKEGKYTVFDMDNFPILNFSETSPIFDTPTGFYIDPYTNDEYIWGFRSVDFIITRLHSQSPIVLFDCRGGNRICMLNPVYLNSKLVGFKFEYISKGVLMVVQFDLTRVQNIVGPYHRHTIFGISASYLNNKLQILTGGVDTDIHLHVLDDDKRAMRKWMTTYHTSSIHSMSTTQCKSNNGETLLATAGGNSQIKLWKIGDEILNHVADYDNVVKYRYVNVKIVEFKNRIFIFGAASIREVHFFELINSSKKSELKRIHVWKSMDYSTIVKLDAIVDRELIKIYSAATSGMVYVLVLNPELKEDDVLETVISIKSTDCGLSAITRVHINGLLATGDESGQINVINVNMKETIEEIFDIHNSTITDICSCKDDNSDCLIASISTDMVFSLTRVKQFDDKYEINVIKKLSSNIGDPMVIITVNDEEKIRNNFLVGGQGFEVINC